MGAYNAPWTRNRAELALLYYGPYGEMRGKEEGGKREEKGEGGREKGPPALLHVEMLWICCRRSICRGFVVDLLYNLLYNKSTTNPRQIEMLYNKSTTNRSPTTNPSPQLNWSVLWPVFSLSSRVGLRLSRGAYIPAGG